MAKNSQSTSNITNINEDSNNNNNNMVHLYVDSSLTVQWHT